jgi:hypothetical protein
MKRGYAATFVNKVSEQWLADNFPDEWAAVAAFIKEHPGQWQQHCEFDTEYPCEPMRRLKRAFDDRYQDLMILNVLWHDSKADGSVFDDINGYAFVVDGAYRRIKAAEEIDLSAALYVQFMEVNCE